MVTQGLHFFCCRFSHSVCVCVCVCVCLEFFRGFLFLHGLPSKQARRGVGVSFTISNTHTHSGLEGTFRERVEGAVWEFPQMYNSKNEDSRSSRCCT